MHILQLLHKTKNLIDDATCLQKEVGLGNFLLGWEKYKHSIFKNYTRECLDSVSFRDYVWHMTCMVKLLEKNTEKDQNFSNNVINLFDYRKTGML